MCRTYAFDYNQATSLKMGFQFKARNGLHYICGGSIEPGTTYRINSSVALPILIKGRNKSVFVCVDFFVQAGKLNKLVGN